MLARDSAAAAAHRPGLVVIATEDHYCGTPEMATHSANRLGAQTMVLDGANHWWMQQRPAEAADALIAFWGASELRVWRDIVSSLARAVTRVKLGATDEHQGRSH